MKIFGADWWDVAVAVGTVGAVIVALVLAFAERKRTKRAEEELKDERASASARREMELAAMVSAWVEITPNASVDGKHYIRQATVHVDNQSDRPAYNGNVCVGVRQTANGWTPVGPLAVPLPLPVLPPHSRQSWDITLALLACSSNQATINGHPTAAISFSDPSGQRWTRDFDLKLSRRETDEDSAFYEIDPNRGEEQVGELLNPMNPITIVIAYLQAARDDTVTLADVTRLLFDPAASGWNGMQDADWQALRESAQSLGVAAHVQYPAPRVAYVKALTDEAAERRIDASGYIELPATIFTLRYLRGIGWPIFGIGFPVAVDMIEFPEGDLHSDPRSSA